MEGPFIICISPQHAGGVLTPFTQGCVCLVDVQRLSSLTHSFSPKTTERQRSVTPRRCTSLSWPPESGFVESRCHGSAEPSILSGCKSWATWSGAQAPCWGTSDKAASLHVVVLCSGAGLCLLTVPGVVLSSQTLTSPSGLATYVTCRPDLAWESRE